ncbi:MAG: tetratricopeptide repeat protein [Chloroflexi bacterium]|nr:tetratricopeptide repeat protein [Chloroflexota bacterium]
MNVYQRRTIFRRRNESNIYRMFFWVVLILGGVWLIRAVQTGEVKPLFLPTPTPTRFALSYALEGNAQFTAGQLEAAILAYQEAARVDPGNARIWADLARIQTYSSAMLVNDEAIRARLNEALTSAQQAVTVAADDSYAHAVLAFALDWSANPALVEDREVQRLLTLAEGEAVRALQLDNTNTLALAFYAEILVDQQKWTQGQQYIEQALERDSSLMDVHRVHAYVLESLGEYALAIDAYDRAIRITPNLTFLYLRAGANYRRLAFDSPNEDIQRQLYEKSLEYFAQTARINQQLGVKDPIPYLSIAKTYAQMVEFFIAIRNVQRTIEFQPENPVFYGELGVLYHKNRNYETGILALKCAIRGCTAEESCEGRGGCGPNDAPAAVAGLPLTATTVYYYDVYASELAALSKPPKINYCPEALDVAAEIEASEFDNDPNIAADITVVRTICTFETEITSTGTEAGGSEPALVDVTPTASP